MHHPQELLWIITKAVGCQFVNYPGMVALWFRDVSLFLASFDPISEAHGTKEPSIPIRDGPVAMVGSGSKNY